MAQNKILKVLFFAAPFILSLKLFTDLPLKPLSEKVYTSQDSSWIPWSEEKLNEFKGKIVFMDFTAEWCLTCKVNKKLVLDTKAFKEFSEKNNVHLLRADWTRRDDHITQFLKRFNVVGVPAYFIQKANGEIKYLGETISIGKIQDSLN